MKVFISTSLITKADDADIAVIPINKDDVKSQEGLVKEFVFDQKYPIPAEGAYIGISYDITLDITSPDEANWKDCYPVFAYIDKMFPIHSSSSVNCMHLMVGSTTHCLAWE